MTGSGPGINLLPAYLSGPNLVTRWVCGRLRTRNGAALLGRLTVTDAISPGPYVPWQEAVIERIEHQTARVKSFLLRPRSWRSFRAGQHLDVRLTALDGYQVQRSYSVASAPGL